MAQGSAPAPSPSPAAPTPRPAVFWALWASMLSGVVMLKVLVAPSGPAAPAATEAAWGAVEFAALAALAASVLVRWVLLPRLDSLARQLPVFIVACALAEACAILGIFVSQSHGRELFVAGLTGLALLAPVFTLPRGPAFPRGQG